MGGDEPMPPRSEDFEGLFDEEFDRCVRVARRIVGSEHLAQELAAEAFARAWARWQTLRGQQPGAWVVKVTVNLAIDTTRKRRLPDARLAAVPSPEDGVVIRIALAEALNRLPQRQRLAIAMRYLGDCSEEDIALAL